jgi:hypothetical protein
MLRWRSGLADRLRSELRAYRLQGLDTGREREAIGVDDVVELSEQGRRFFICQIESHDPDMGSLTNGREVRPETGSSKGTLTNPGATCRKGSAMNESDIEDRLDLNSGKEWSEVDLFDLANSVRLNQPVEEVAMFLCRSRLEVSNKVAELEQSGELATRIEETAANALPD